ncbi:alcohol oxidase [Mycena metata]|uniref:Alcohol oxidase n=1 Tax=Mycena metata TaxID=1033252 RepID=A0AAD7JKR2_9AGAR|nr:alcohol oxidase [Mycena metata]
MMVNTLLLIVGGFSTLPSIFARGDSCSSVLKPTIAADATAFATTIYDYIIVGGGTAGLALAARLTENSRITVGVIEAGIYHLGDPTLLTPELAIPGGQGNASYDWLFKTIPQPGANGRMISQPRGKMIGGSSGLNLLAWNRASQPEYDAWSIFSGSKSWSWAGLTEYFAKSQNIEQGQTNPFPGVSREQTDTSCTYGSANGPINVSYNVIYSDTVPTYVETWNKLGIETNGNPDSGSTTGIYNSRMSISRLEGIRSYSANGYFAQSCSRSNLHVLAGAEATKISLKKTSTKWTATGITYTVGSKVFAATASKEIILSAGTAKTPQLLELSGIGNSTLLKSIGIQPLIDLPQVGENLQEHVFTLVEFELNPGHQTFDALINNATFFAQQSSLYKTKHTGWLAANDGALSFLPLQVTASQAEQKALLAAFNDYVTSCNLTPIQRVQYELQREWLAKGRVPMTETIMMSRGLIAPQPGRSYLTLLTGVQHPLARGSIHINSSVPTASPVINGNYVGNDFDVQTLLQSVKFLLKLAKTPPLSEIVKTVAQPTATSDADLIEWIRNTVAVGDHILGTAAMATQEQGGVVDHNLIVYGTANLRIVDASIMPYTIAAHLQSTVYAIAEKAAALLLG